MKRGARNYESTRFDALVFWLLYTRVPVQQLEKLIDEIGDRENVGSCVSDAPSLQAISKTTWQQATKLSERIQALMGVPGQS